MKIWNLLIEISINCFFLNDKYGLCTNSVVCALFQSFCDSTIAIADLCTNIISIMVFKKSIWLKNKNYVIKTQLLFYSMFAMMNYKIQNFMMTYTILNLIYADSDSNKRFSKKFKIMKKHKKFCLIYIQLSWFWKFEKFQLFNSVFMWDFENKAHLLLLREIKRLSFLNVETLERWSERLEHE